MLCPSPWFNLRHQQYQPNSAHGPHGYLLTSVENLAKVRHEVQYKDKKGIMRIRTSFLQERSELLAVGNQSHPTASSESLRSELNSEIQDRGTSSKSKVKALKNLFKPKTLKISEQQEESTGAAEGPSATAESSSYQPPVNLRLSRKEPVRYGLAYVAEERQCLELYHGDGFSGGACLKVHPSDELCSEHRYTRLLHCNFPCHESLIFCVVTKNVPQHPDQTLNVKLNMRNAADEFLSVVLTGRSLSTRTELGARAAGVVHVAPLRTHEPAVLRDLRCYLLLSPPGYYVPVDNAFGWTVRSVEFLLSVIVPYTPNN